MTDLDLLISSIKTIRDHTEFSGLRFLALTQSLDVAVVFCDGADRIVEANDPALRMLAAVNRDVVGRRVVQVLGNAGRDLLRRVRGLAADLNGAVIEGELTDIAGATQAVSVYAHVLRRTAAERPSVMLLVLPAHQREALHHALSHAGSTPDHLATFLLMAREDERKRIAADLHDGLGQQLTMLKFKIENALIQLDAARIDATRALLREAAQGLRDAVGDVRRISTELRPSMLDDLGLVSTLQWLARQFESAHGTVRVTLELKAEEEMIPVTLKAVVFRLIQEALNNVAKHAQASSVFVYLRAHQGVFMVGIVDNGSGFDAGGILSGRHCLLGVGLNSMRERVEASNGSFRITSHAGSGTSVTAAWGERDPDFGWSGPALLDREVARVGRAGASTAPLDLDLARAS